MPSEEKKMNDYEVAAKLPTRYGLFLIKAYHYLHAEQPNLALHTENLDVNQPLAVRVHSECMTGDVFGSAKCDCGEQLEYAMKWVQEHGGIIVYLRQEGRGIGLVNKLRAYNLQDAGLNTREANLELGFHEDPRDFTPAIEILKQLGVKKIKLLTNNPNKIASFDNTDIEVVERLPIEIPAQPENMKYLQTKKNEMGHLLSSKLF